MELDHVVQLYSYSVNTDVRSFSSMNECNLYICHECLASYLFDEDLQDHKSETGHSASTVLKSNLVRLDDRVIAFFQPT